MEHLQTLPPITDGMPASHTGKQRIAQLGLETGDIVVIKTILGASRELAQRFQYHEGAYVTGSFDVLFVNGEDAASIRASRALHNRRNIRVVQVGGETADQCNNQHIRRPVTPRALEAVLLTDSTGRASASQEAAPSKLSAVPSPHSSNKLRVLIVDDSLPAREFIRFKIEELGKHAAGIEIDTATSGEQAIEKYQQSPCDLVFMDVEMPGMDGFATCRKLKALNNSVRVVMLTSKSLSQDYMKGREVGCNHYLTKPPLDNDVKTILTLASLTKTTARGQA